MLRPPKALAALALICSLTCVSGCASTLPEQRQASAAKAADGRRRLETGPSLSPVVFVPGVGGSQLDAKLDGAHKSHPLCRSHTANWFNVWLNINLLNPIGLICLNDILRLEYNRTTKLTSSPKGVQVSAHEFGSLDSVEFLDRSAHLPGTAYFRTIVGALETRLGFEPNENMFGAPYDFRRAPNELAEFDANLTTLIERAYIENNFEPITLICHSMGCLNTVHLLNARAQHWKDVYVRRLVALGAPWRGSFRALSSLLLGDNLGIPFVDDHKLRKTQITFPSLLYLLPQRPAAPAPIAPVELVATSSKVYTFDNLDELFVDAKLDDQREMWLNVRNYTLDLRAPNVELWCLYGTGLATPTKVEFDGELLESRATQATSLDGDGTVGLESSMGCAEFKRAQEAASKGRYAVHLRPFAGVGHVAMLRSKQVAEYIADEILGGGGGGGRERARAQ